MAKCIAVLDLPPRRSHGKTRDSFHAAASRWGCEVIWIRQPLASCHPFWQKFLVCSHVHNVLGHCHVLQLDNDMLIRDDCPSPFDRISESQFGLVAGRQGLFDRLGRDAWAYRAHGTWARRLGTVAAPTWSHPNGGFYLYNTKSYLNFFNELFSAGPFVQFDKRLGCDETLIINRLWSCHRDRIVFLPSDFNTVLHHNPHMADFPPMRTFVYHFVGWTKRRLAKTWWQRGSNPPLPVPCSPVLAAICQALLSEGEDGVRRGVEVSTPNDSGAATLLPLFPWLVLFCVEPTSTQLEKGFGDGIGLEERRVTGGSRALELSAVLHSLGPNASRWFSIGMPASKSVRSFDDSELDFVVVKPEWNSNSILDLLVDWRLKLRYGGMVLVRLDGLNTGRVAGIARSLDIGPTSGWKCTLSDQLLCLRRI